MSNKPKDDEREADEPAITLPGVVEKIIPPVHSSLPEKAQIFVEGAEELYREIRVENTLQDAEGNPVGLKEGAEVEITIEAGADAIKPKEGSGAKESHPTPPLAKKKNGG